MLDSQTIALAVAIADDAAAMDLTAYCLAVETVGMTWRRLPDADHNSEDAVVARRAADYLECRLRVQRHPQDASLVRLLPRKSSDAESGGPQPSSVCGVAEPSKEMADKGMHVLSEWLNDNAPIGEGRYRAPAIAVYKAMATVKEAE